MSIKCTFGTCMEYFKRWKLISITQIYIQFSSVQSLSHVWLFATPWIIAHQASLSITNSRSSLRLTYIESVMPFSHLILCHPLLLPLIPPSIRVFSNESALCMRWPKCFINLSCLASTWVPVRSTKCQVWFQDVNVKTEPENLHENQAPWIAGSQGSPEGKQWFWMQWKQRNKNPLLLRKY